MMLSYLQPKQQLTAGYITSTALPCLPINAEAEFPPKSVLYRAREGLEEGLVLRSLPWSEVLEKRLRRPKPNARVSANQRAGGCNESAGK